VQVAAPPATPCERTRTALPAIFAEQVTWPDAIGPPPPVSLSVAASRTVNALPCLAGLGRSERPVAVRVGARLALSPDGRQLVLSRRDGTRVGPPAVDPFDPGRCTRGNESRRI
jgi:hypothetical protein